LSDFGAEVIKIEQPGVGDSLRRFGTPTECDDTLVWLNEARNHQSVTHDLRTLEGADIFCRLVEKSDVVLENFRPGTLEKWGLPYEQLAAINPKLVMLRVSAYGQTGPTREKPGIAAKWGDLVFVIYPNLAMGRTAYGLCKAHLEETGRGRDNVAVTPAVYVLTGESEGEAQDGRAAIEALAKPIDGLVLLSEVLNFDFASKGYDEPFFAEEMDGISGIQAIRDRVVKISGTANPTPSDFLTHAQRGTLAEVPVFAGTPVHGADQMEEWFGEACDGFVIAAGDVPGSYVDFVRLVVPELQRRGLFRTEYEGATLRENLGLARPAV
jgi:hypothetical protein